MYSTKLLLVASLLASLFAVSFADIYFAGQTIQAAPIYYGQHPFLPFGNITGVITFGNATNAKGNIVLCPTFSAPTEDTLLWCIQGQPAGVISVFPPTGTTRVPFLGRTMYNIGKPYYDPTLEPLRQTHIVEIDQSDFNTLATAAVAGLRLTMDGSTENPWLVVNEGGWTIWYQVSCAVLGFLVAVKCGFVLREWHMRGELGWNLKTFVTVINLVVNLFRTFYCAVDPTGLRRIIRAKDDLICTTFILTCLVETCTACSLYWLETITNRSFKIRYFLQSRWVKAIFYGNGAVWLALLIIWRGMAESPTLSPLATGTSLFALILIQVILIGASAAAYSAISSVLFYKINQMESAKSSNNSSTKSSSRSSRWWYRAVYLGGTSLCLWSLFAVTVTALFPPWYIPWVPQVLQWWCYIAHPLVQGLQVVSFNTQSDSNSSKRTFTMSKSKATTSSMIPEQTERDESDSESDSEA